MEVCLIAQHTFNYADIAVGRLMATIDVDQAAKHKRTAHTVVSCNLDLN